MATRSLVTVFPANPNDEALHQGSIRILKWTGLTNASSDVGAVLGTDYAGYTDRSVQVFGTFGTGGTCTIQGSLDGTNWATLNDPQGNALTVQAAKIEALLEAVPYLRPNITAGDGTTNLDCWIFLRQNRMG